MTGNYIIVNMVSAWLHPGRRFSHHSFIEVASSHIPSVFPPLPAAFGPALEDQQLMMFSTGSNTLRTRSVTVVVHWDESELINVLFLISSLSCTAIHLSHDLPALPPIDDFSDYASSVDALSYHDARFARISYRQQ